MIKFALDASQFNKAFDKYMTFQKRLPADVINAKLFYIARNATMLTKTTNKERIDSELRGNARSYDAPLAAVIINSQLGKEGKKGFTGSKMARAIEKLIKTRKSHVNFVRAGWKNAINILENYLRIKGELSFVRRYQNTAPVDKETMRNKNFEKLGKAIPARVEVGPRVWGQIQNDVSGKNARNLANLEHVKLEGLQNAVNKEAASMIQYIERKLTPVHQEFNRQQQM